MKEEAYYNRQIKLKEVGVKGQNKLRKTSVLIVGAGGLGHPVASFLASSGIGKIIICDFDKIEESNLHRQFLFNYDNLGNSKSLVLASVLKKQNPFINIISRENKLTKKNIKEQLKGIDIVVDCTDNFVTKFLLHDACFLLNKDLVQASIYQYDGLVHIFPFKSSKDILGCYRCHHEKIPEEGCIGNCSESGVIAAVPGVLGSIQAMEVIKLVLNIGSFPQLTTKVINLLDTSINTFKWKRNSKCFLCGENSKINSISQLEYGSSLAKYKIGSMDNLSKYKIVDIRSNLEIKESPLNLDSEKLCYNDFSKWKYQIPNELPYLFICQKSVRSKQIVSLLLKEGHINCFYLSSDLNKEIFL